tara:strand:- start:638 stop:784 length:147 start_codon:yes stop_codon:yes gene_type:complete
MARTRAMRISLRAFTPKIRKARRKFATKEHTKTQKSQIFLIARKQNAL